MSRRKGHDKAAVERRGRLEDAVAVLVRAEIVLPMVRLRVAQALDRTGLEALLAPALEDLVATERALAQAKRMIAREAEGFPDGNCSSRERAKTAPVGVHPGLGCGCAQNAGGGPEKHAT